MNLVVIGILLFILVVVSLVLFFMISVLVGLVQTRGVPFVSTPAKNFDAICQAAGIKSGEKVYDLGCGKAHFLVLAAQKYGAKGVGYELSLWPYLWGWFNIWNHHADVKIRLADFFKADLSDADVVFCYLFPEIMAKLEPKFKQELKPTARVVSYAFKLPQTEPVETVVIQSGGKKINNFLETSPTIYVYRFNQ